MVEYVSCIKSEKCRIYRDFFDTSDKINISADKYDGLRAHLQIIPEWDGHGDVSYSCVVFQYHCRHLRSCNVIENYAKCDQFVKKIFENSNHNAYHFQLVKYDSSGRPIDIYHTDPIIPYFKTFYPLSISDCTTTY